MVRHFLKDDDITSAEQAEILELALKLKSAPYSEKVFAGPKTVAVIFDKTSTRTRVSFAVGIADLGGVPLIMDSGVSQLGAKESVADTAKVLERQVAQIVWRTYAQSGLEEMAHNSIVPVINSLSDSWHPCQLLADLMTIKERFGKTEGLKLAYIGDAANNMGNSYLVACALAGMDVSVAAPIGYQPDPAVVARAAQIAESFGRKVEVLEEADRLVGMLMWGVAATLLGLAGLVFFAVFLTVLVWDEHRLLALGIFAAVFIGSAVFAVASVLRLARQGSQLFAASLAELRRDEAALADSPHESRP
jgi:ornithine carbamoyltransferase